MRARSGTAPMASGRLALARLLGSASANRHGSADARVCECPQNSAPGMSPLGSLYTLYQNQPTKGLAYFAGYGSAGLEFITSPYAKSRDQNHTVLVLGADAVGKSSLVLHLVKEWSLRNSARYDPYDTTITFKSDGEEKSINLVEVDSEKDDLWRSIAAAGALLLYSLTDWSTFRQAERLAGRLRASILANGQPVWLVGTHLDAEMDGRRAVPKQDVLSLCKRVKCHSTEVAVSRLISPTPPLASKTSPVYDLAEQMVSTFSAAAVGGRQQAQCKGPACANGAAKRHQRRSPPVHINQPVASATNSNSGPSSAGSRMHMLRNRMTHGRQQLSTGEHHGSAAGNAMHGLMAALTPRRGVSGAESTASLNAAGTAARALDASESSNRGEMAAHRALLRNELLKSCIDDVAVAQKWENGGFRGGDCETSKEATVTSLSFTGSMVGITAASSSRPLVAVASAPQMSSNGGNASPLPMPLGHNASATGLFQYGFNKTPTKTPPRQGGSSCGTPRTSPRTENQQNGSPLVSPGLLGSKSAPPKSYHFGNRPPVPMGSPAVRNLSALYSLSPLSENSHRLLRSPRKPPRKIPKNPYKVLDAPELQDDFYLNLVDWSSQNVLAVGLGHCVYLWSAANSQVVKLCDLASEGDDLITAVQWSERGDLLAVGTSHGLLHVWDTTQTKKILNRPGHLYRIGCIAWNGDLACSGSRDRTILQRDIRAPENSAKERKLLGHKQEVCGLKWSPDHQFLASGGNDNQLLIWSLRKDQPVQTYVEHVAAVKALAWSPHQHGLLVSGGGTADRCLRFWNTLTGQAMQKIDTGSQVCNVAWSRHTRELVSTHGYSQNQIVIWKYPSLGQVAKLTGHTTRVLYLATSPDGESIVTGAGDETLRFWHVFNKQRNPKEERSQLNFYMSIR